MVRGYYSDFTNFNQNNTVDDNLVGYGLSEKKPYKNQDEENYNTGIARINQCIGDILTTPKGTRFFKPQYGSRIHELVSEPNDFVAKDLARLYTQQALEEWEPRITLRQIDTQSENKTIYINIFYSIKNSNDTGSFVYSFNRQVPELG